MIVLNRLILIQRELGSNHSLLCPSILWMQCFQGSMERCIKSPCMKVAYLTYFAYLISISIFNILCIWFCSRIGWRSACGFLLDWSSNGGWVFSWKVIFCIFNVNMLFRIMLYWALCVFIPPTTTGVTLFSTPPSWWVIRNTRVKCVSLQFLLCPRNWRGRIGRTWCLSARQGYLKGLFSWGWITSGSANFCSCLKFIQGQTQACSTVSVPMFLCWKSTLALENQVILCIFCILSIFWIVCEPQRGLDSVNLQWSTSAVSKHKSCMWFQYPPFWDAFL